MDGENHGNPYSLMDDLEGKPTIFGNTHLQSMSKNILKDNPFEQTGSKLRETQNWSYLYVSIYIVDTPLEN